MLEVKLFDLGYCDEKEYTRVVCVSKYKDKYVFSYNKKRNGWEIPGGHIEQNETWEEAAKREMYEETGATKIKLTPIAVYKINSFALLCFCEIFEMDELPKEFEIEKINLQRDLEQHMHSSINTLGLITTPLPNTALQFLFKIPLGIK